MSSWPPKIESRSMGGGLDAHHNLRLTFSTSDANEDRVISPSNNGHSTHLPTDDETAGRLFICFIKKKKK